MRIQYEGGPGVSKKLARIAGPIIQGLEKKHGHVTAEMVVRAATPKSSPLHGYFEWNDAKAAHQHRLELARGLMRSIRVVIEPAPGREERTSHGFVKLTKTRGYAAIGRILSSHVLRAQMVEQAMAELRSWRERYHNLKELAEVFDAIETISQKARSKAA